MKDAGRSRSRVWLALVVLGTGLLPGTCMIRTRSALIDGSKSFLANTLLNPDNLGDLPFEDVADAITGQP